MTKNALIWHEPQQPYPKPAKAGLDVQLLLKVKDFPVPYLTASWDGQNLHTSSTFGYQSSLWAPFQTNSMTKKTPVEVRRAIAADLKLKGINYIQAANDLGYKNKQSIASILSNKSASYLPLEQALRFSHSYNYSPKFLMTGEGQLYTEKTDSLEGKVEAWAVLP